MTFSMHSGDTKRLNFTLLDGTGQPLDITDAAVRWQCSRYRNGKFSSTPALTKTVNNGIEVTDEFNGLLTVFLYPEDTEEISGEFYHELQVTDASGDIATPFVGTFVVNKSLVKGPD